LRRPVRHFNYCLSFTLTLWLALVTGVNADSFDPEAKVTRAHLAVMAARALGLEYPQVTGMVDTGCSVTVNGIPAAVEPSGRFVADVALAVGGNTLTIKAFDSSGSIALFDVFIRFSELNPSLLLQFHLSLVGTES